MIGGVQPCSFIDYPGRLSAVVFLRGCNLRCPYCHNPGLLDGDAPAVMERDELLAFLSSRRGMLDGVVFSGGEPTLQPGLRPLIEAARAMGFKIKLDTNGTRPEALSELLGDRLLDYVALDLKDEPEAYAEWLGMRESAAALPRSMDLVKSSGVDHEFRTTVVRSRHDEARLARMARWAAGCRRWILQACRPDPTRPADEPSSSREDRTEDLASRLRERYGIACRCRTERIPSRGFTPTDKTCQGEAACV